MKYKLSRNDPCPCGSGRKYKKCCLMTGMGIEQASFRKRVQARVGDDIAWLDSGSIKMSEIIIAFADELLETAKTDQAKETVMMLAITAWNLAIIDNEQEQTCQLDTLRQAMKIKERSEDWYVLEVIIKALIDKKHLDYPDIDRLIMDYEFIKVKDGFHLNVASLVKPN